MIGSSLSLPEAPYRGIESFRFVDHPIFFARDDEIQALLRQVTIYRGVLFYGASGVGKSSLINAGLIPQLLKNGFNPERVRLQPRRSAELIIKRISLRSDNKSPYLPSIFIKDANSKELNAQTTFSIRKFSQMIEHLPKKIDQRPVLIFDQFEEFVTLFEDSSPHVPLNTKLSIQEDLLKLIVKLMRNRLLSLKLLFVFREDYLAKLTKLFIFSPELPDQYVRLTPPEMNNILNIILGPFSQEKLKDHFGGELPSKLAKKLAKEIVAESESNEINLTELQIACLELWKSDDPKELLKESRNIQDILERYLTRAIVNELSTKSLREAAIALLSKLVTKSGTRNIVSEEDLIERVRNEDDIEEDIVGNALTLLENKTKLIRKEFRHEIYFYEIVSEFLIPWIMDQRTKQVARLEHFMIVKQGVKIWNNWRNRNIEIEPDLNRVDLSGADLAAVNLSQANLRGANLSGANFKSALLSNADLSEANLMESVLDRADLENANLDGANLDASSLVSSKLRSANLGGCSLKGARILKTDLSDAFLGQCNLDYADMTDSNLKGVYLGMARLVGTRMRRVNLEGANLYRADMKNVDMTQSNLIRADLRETDLSGANLKNANLNFATMVNTNLRNADISNSLVYGISAWNLVISASTKQNSLIITREDEAVITVDNLEISQFIYLLLMNEKVREIIDPITQKAVLVLGSFTKERKAVLDAIRHKLRELGFVPMILDLEKPTQRDFTETVKVLGGLSRFIIADITNPKSTPLELQATMPDYSIPLVPILQENEMPFAMFQNLQQRYGNWVLDVIVYDSVENLIVVMEDAVIKPAIKKANELLLKKVEEMRDRRVKDYI